MAPIHDEDFDLRHLNRSMGEVRRAVDNLGLQIVRDGLKDIDRRAERGLLPLLILDAACLGAFVWLLVFA